MEVEELLVAAATLPLAERAEVLDELIGRLESHLEETSASPGAPSRPGGRPAAP